MFILHCQIFWWFFNTHTGVFADKVVPDYKYGRYATVCAIRCKQIYYDGLCSNPSSTRPPSGRDSYVIALRSLWYRTAKAMVSHLDRYGIAPRKLCYLAPARQKPRFRPRFFAPSSPFRRFPITGMRQKPNTLLSSIFLIFNISRCVGIYSAIYIRRTR